MLDPLLINGNTSVPMIGPGGAQLTNIQGVAFSNIDYNLWDGTTLMGGSAGHGINTTPDDSRTTVNGFPVAGGESMYFGLQDPNAATVVGAAQPGATNYQYQNAQDYDTYNMPGGASGSLVSTTPFSLAGYTAQDVPTLSFTYYVDATGPANYDTLRVFISNDGANWTLLDQLSGANGGAGWKQAVLNIGAFAGDSNLLLRFDFSTAGDMDTGDLYVAGNTSQDQGVLGGVVSHRGSGRPTPERRHERRRFHRGGRRRPSLGRHWWRFRLRHGRRYRRPRRGRRGHRQRPDLHPR